MLIPYYGVDMANSVEKNFPAYGIENIFRASRMMK